MKGTTNMNEKRRDNKNRVLHNGESQMPDGRYRYRYKDIDGSYKAVYSWKLEKTDAAPSGKKSGKCLRDIERDIEYNSYDNIFSGEKLTVCELVERYISTKQKVRPTTRNGYKFVMKILSDNKIGNMNINKIRYSDAKLWFISLKKDKNYSYSYINQIRNVLRPAFAMAVRDNYIRQNPFDFKVSEIINDEHKEKVALTQKQEDSLLEFIVSDGNFQRYYDAIYVLLNTGLRISEFVGLTIHDVDFDNHKLKITKQLKKTYEKKFYIAPPKTKSGTRDIPLSKETERHLRNMITYRVAPKIEPMIDGYTGFLFMTKNGTPYDASEFDVIFKRIIQKYNETHSDQLVNVTPHSCRHTFCSKLIRNNVNPKVVQYIMGHEDATITMNVYSHITFDDVKKELDRTLTA